VLAALIGASLFTLLILYFKISTTAAVLLANCLLLCVEVFFGIFVFATGELTLWFSSSAHFNFLVAC
jgi:hypothetical protein